MLYFLCASSPLPGYVHSVAFSLADPLMAMSVGADGVLASWLVKREDDEMLPGSQFAGGDASALLSLACHPVYAEVAAVGCEDGKVCLWRFRPQEGANEAGEQGVTDGHQKLQDLKGHSKAASQSSPNTFLYLGVCLCCCPTCTVQK